MYIKPTPEGTWNNTKYIYTSAECFSVWNQRGMFIFPHSVKCSWEISRPVIRMKKMENCFVSCGFAFAFLNGSHLRPKFQAQQEIKYNGFFLFIRIKSQRLSLQSDVWIEIYDFLSWTRLKSLLTYESWQLQLYYFHLTLRCQLANSKRFCMYIFLFSNNTCFCQPGAIYVIG